MHVFLTLEIEGETITPQVGVMTSQPSYDGRMLTNPDLDTVRLGTEVTRAVLNFAEDLARPKPVQEESHA